MLIKFSLEASLRWDEVRDNMFCFVRLSERNIGGDITARRVSIKHEKYYSNNCISNRGLGKTFVELIVERMKPIERWYLIRPTLAIVVSSR